MLFSNKYQKLSVTTEPIPDIEQDAHGFFKRWAELIYASRLAGTASPFYSKTGRRTVGELRSYGEGRQDVTRYKNTIIGSHTASKTGRTEIGNTPDTNISWDNPRPFEKYRNLLIDKFQSLKLGIQPIANDATSKHAKAKKVAEMRVLASPDYNQLSQNNPYKEKPEAGFETSDAVDLFEQLGGPTLGVEILMKDLVDEVIKDPASITVLEMMYRDKIDLNFICADVIRTAGGDYKLKYIDPENFIIQETMYEDAHDVPYMAYIEHQTIKQVAEESDLDYEQLVEIANAYRGQLGNPDTSITQQSARTHGRGNMPGASYRIQVMTFYVIDFQQKRYMSGVAKNGTTIYKEVDATYTLNNNAKKKGRKIETKNQYRLYQAKWVVGTEIIFNAGPKTDCVYITRRGGSIPRFPIAVYYGQESSITEKVIPAIDEICLARYKLRALMKSMPPGPRIAFDISKMLPNTQVGGVDYTVLDSIEMFAREGVFLYSSRLPGTMAGDYSMSQDKPWTNIDAGIVEDMRVLAEVIRDNIEEIRGITGDNPITDGTNKQPDMLKSVVASFQQSANSAVSPHLLTFINFYGRLTDYIANLWRVRSLDDGLSAEIFRGYKDSIYNINFGITIVPDTAEMRQMIMTNLMERQSVLPPDSYFLVLRAVQDSDYTKAQVLLTLAMKKAEEVAHKRQMEQLTAAAEANADAAERAAAAKMKEKAADIDGKLKLLDRQHANAMELRAMVDENTLDRELALQEKMKETGVVVAEANKTRS